MNILIFWDRGAPAGLEIPVARIISQILDIPAEVCESPVLYNGFDRSRNQFDASAILTCLDVFSRRNEEKRFILLVTGYLQTGHQVCFWSLPPRDWHCRNLIGQAEK